MAEPLSLTVSLLTAVGLGGILGAYFQARFQQRAQISQHEHELKQKRYLCILMIMIAKLRPADGIVKLRGYRPDLQNIEDVDEELTAELFNGFIYASDGVMESLSAFIRQPSDKTLVATAVAMRRDLWDKKTLLNESVLATLSDSVAAPV